MDSYTEISTNPKEFIIRHKLSERSITIQNTVFKNFFFESFERRGKYPEMKYSYNHEEKILTFIYNKKYSTEVMNLKKYELIVHARCNANSFEDFMETLKVMADSKIFKSNNCKLVKVDILGMILMKNYNSISWKGEPIIQKLFLKFSPYEFRRTPPQKLNNKDCDQSFSSIWKQENVKFESLEEENMDEEFVIPSDSEFEKSPRIAFIDDLIYTNDSLAKRFGRFLTFYQAHSIFMNSFVLDNRYIREFYLKCFSRSMVSSMRLKKITYDYKFTRVSKEKDQVNDKDKEPRYIEKYKEHGVSLNLLCNEEEISKNDTIGNTFTIELISELETSEKMNSVQESFFNHLHKSFNANLSSTNSNMFIEVYTEPSIQNKTVKIKNELGFCQLLSHLTFLIDRITFKSVLKETPGEYHITSGQNLEEQCMYFRTPLSEEFKSKKYAYSYCLEIRSQYNYQNSNSMDENHYENSIHKIIMMRKSLAKIYRDSKENSENLEFSCISEQYKESMRGLIVYVNEVLKKWNARDCYHDLNSFVANYLNIIVDKNKEKSDKSLLKSTAQWKQIIDGLSALVESLARIFNAPNYAVILHILRTHEDTKIEDIISHEVNEGEEVMLMTIKILKITSAGWIEIVPSCLYFFEMQRDQTFLYKKGEERVELPIKSSKDQIERAFSAYLNRTIKNKSLLSFWSRNL